MEIFLQTDWFTGRDQQMFDLVFDVLVGWWSMLGLPCCWLYSSRADGWPGWAARSRPALAPFTVVLAGLPLQPLPRLYPDHLHSMGQPGRFLYLHPGLPASSGRPRESVRLRAVKQDGDVKQTKSVRFSQQQSQPRSAVPPTQFCYF